MDRRILTSKLANYGIGCIVLVWISSYFQGRSQTVVHRMDGNKYSSDDRELEWDVPQGSVLGLDALMK